MRYSRLQKTMTPRSLRMFFSDILHFCFDARFCQCDDIEMLQSTNVVLPPSPNKSIPRNHTSQTILNLTNFIEKRNNIYL
jgi:hypothetical protein